MTPIPFSLRLYAAATRAVSPLAPLLLARRSRRGKEDPARISERLGVASVERPPGPLIWLHGSSVGEGLALLPLVSRLHAARPELTVLVTSGTRASAQLLVERLPAGALHQYAPIDTPGAVARFLDHWRPDAAVLAESELWPNLILLAKTRGARLALISARMSAASFRRWRRFHDAARALLGAFDLILARDEAEARRFRALGAKVEGLADIKFGAEPLPADEAALTELRARLAGASVVLAASTHPGEEALALEAFAKADGARLASLVIVPRHVGRGPEIARLAADLGLAVTRRAAGEPLAGAGVHVADTLGELGLWYRLANLAVMGGSLVAGVGGHNPLEPARLCCPVAAGPFTESWPVYADLEARSAALRVADDAGLAAAMAKAISAPRAFEDMARAAKGHVLARDAESAGLAARILGLMAT